MKPKVFESFDEAVADITDGATVAMFCWGYAGTPQNLIRALRDKGVKDLTIISHNFVPGWIGKHMLPGEELASPFVLFSQVKKLITAWTGLDVFGIRSPLEEMIRKGEVELEITSHGTLAERLRAGASGIGGFYSPVGIGTVLEEGKEKRIIEGKEYILEKPLRADFGFVRAHKSDKRGNLVYYGSGRACNPLIAMASDITIAEVDEIVEVGELDPEVIITPSIFVNRIIGIPEGALGSFKNRIELRRKYLGGGK